MACRPPIRHFNRLWCFLAVAMVVLISLYIRGSRVPPEKNNYKIQPLRLETDSLPSEPRNSRILNTQSKFPPVAVPKSENSIDLHKEEARIKPSPQAVYAKSTAQQENKSPLQNERTQVRTQNGAQPVENGNGSRNDAMEVENHIHQTEAYSGSGPTRKCIPVHHVAFVKTHKAASSTVTSILLRFGISRNLTFALPNRGYHKYAYNYITKPGDVMGPGSVRRLLPGQTEYNILCHHATYNRTAFRAIMPPQTIFISILREPFSQFFSSFEYYMGAEYRRHANDSTNPLSQYLQGRILTHEAKNRFTYIKGKQAQDMGFGGEEYNDVNKAKLFIAQLEQDFGLIMIKEYFQESLILLKRRLCWDTKDILYMTHNKNKLKHALNFTEADYKSHRKIAHLDYLLYGHFLEVFNKTLKQQDQDFFDEVKDFTRLLTAVYTSCDRGDDFNVSGTQWYDSFQVTWSDCKLIRMHPLTGLDLLLNQGHRNGTASLDRQLWHRPNTLLARNFS